MVNLQEKNNFWENIINYQIVTYLLGRNLSLLVIPTFSDLI